MFFKRKESPLPAPEPCRRPSPRRAFAALCPPGSRIMVAAGRRRVPLARADPRHVFARPIRAGRSRAAGAPLANKGGVAGAWLADLLLYLFGLLGVVVGRRGGVVLVVAGYRRWCDPSTRPDHPLGSGVLGFALVLLASAALEAICACTTCRRRCRRRPAARSGDVIGRGLSRVARLQRRDAVAARALRRRLRRCSSAMSWLKADGTHRRRHRSRVRVAAAPRRRAARTASIGEQALTEREAVVAGQREDVGARAGRRRAARRRRCRNRERVVEGTAAAALRRSARFAAAAAGAARRRPVGAGDRSAPRRSSTRRD